MLLKPGISNYSEMVEGGVGGGEKFMSHHCWEESQRGNLGCKNRGETQAGMPERNVFNRKSS